jgi:hypothetical protein
MEPSGSINISQSLFLVDEKLMKPSHKLANRLDQTMVSEWNSIGSIGQGISGQLPAYLNQARLSTWYQDNGSEPLLQFSNQFGLAPMGGPFNGNISTGARVEPVPANKVAKAGYALYDDKYYPVEQPKSLVDNIMPNCNNGICLPKFMPSLTPKQTGGL